VGVRPVLSELRRILQLVEKVGAELKIIRNLAPEAPIRPE
jgi:hypothetical protein